MLLLPAARDISCTGTSYAVMISNQPRPTSISEDLRDFYLKQENGRKLLAGVKIIPEGETDSVGGTAHDEVGRCAFRGEVGIMPVRAARLC